MHAYTNTRTQNGDLHYTLATLSVSVNNAILLLLEEHDMKTQLKLLFDEEKGGERKETSAKAIGHWQDIFDNLIVRNKKYNR